MGGRLEHEIRLLPQVLSCSFTNDDHVVVLVDPSADAHTIQMAVGRILQHEGSEATVRVIGPPEPVEASATRVLSPLVATATVATVAAIGVGALVGSLAAVDHPQKQVEAPKRPAGAPAGSPLDSIDVLRRLQVSIAVPATLAVPVEAPDRTLRVLPASRGSAAEAVSLTKAMPPVHSRVKQASAPESPHPRHKHRGRHKGWGPRPWSHSSQIMDKDHRGKGMDRG